MIYPGQSWRSGREQREVFKSAEEIGHFGRIRKTAFEMLDTDAARIEYIGAYAQRHGQEWVDENPDLIKWLEKRNLGISDAIRQYEEWRDRESENPFWKKKKA